MTEIKATNITWHEGSVTRDERALLRALRERPRGWVRNDDYDTFVIDSLRRVQTALGPEIPTFGTYAAQPLKHALAPFGFTFWNGPVMPGRGGSFAPFVQWNSHAQSFRAVWIAGDWDAGTIDIDAGESGEPGSPHYTDQSDAWANFKRTPLPFSDAAVRAANILKKFAETGETMPNFATTLNRDALDRQLASEDFWQLLLSASRSGTAIERAISSGEPAHVAKYAFQLAQSFNNFYHSCHVLAEQDAEKRTFLLDYGWTPDVINGNMDLLKVDASKIDTLIMSHGHFDHLTGLDGLIRRLGTVNLPVLIHPDFWRRRRVAIPGRDPFEIPTTSRY